MICQTCSRMIQASPLETQRYTAPNSDHSIWHSEQRDNAQYVYSCNLPGSRIDPDHRRRKLTAKISTGCVSSVAKGNRLLCARSFALLLSYSIPLQVRQRHFTSEAISKQTAGVMTPMLLIETAVLIHYLIRFIFTCRLAEVEDYFSRPINIMNKLPLIASIVHMKIYKKANYLTNQRFITVETFNIG